MFTSTQEPAAGQGADKNQTAAGARSTGDGKEKGKRPGKRQRAELKAKWALEGTLRPPRAKKARQGTSQEPREKQQQMPEQQAQPKEQSRAGGTKLAKSNRPKASGGA
jgi:hypothetical protein